jgi:leucyl aminopeptidase
MQISFVTPTAVTSGAWVVGALEGGALLPAALRADKASAGALSRAVKVSKFTGKSGQFVEVLAPAGLTASRLLLVGLGKADALDEKGLETLGAQIAARLFAGGDTVASLEIDAPPESKKGGNRLKKGEIAAHLAFGATLRSYACA